MLVPATWIEISDEGVSQGKVNAFDFVGSGVAATVAGNIATITISGGGVASIGAGWNFDTATGAADPGNKKFRLNNATLASVTAIYLNDTTNEGFDISTIASFLASGNRIYVQQKNDATRAALFQVSGPATDNGGWWTVPVTTLADGGVLYQNNADCGFVFMLNASAGSITVSQATLSMPYASQRQVISVTDAAVNASSKILCSLGPALDTDANADDDIDLLGLTTVPAAGSFQVRMNFLTPAGGPLKLNYVVG